MDWGDWAGGGGYEVGVQQVHEERGSSSRGGGGGGCSAAQRVQEEQDSSSTPRRHCLGAGSQYAGSSPSLLYGCSSASRYLSGGGEISGEVRVLKRAGPGRAGPGQTVE